MARHRLAPRRRAPARAGRDPDAHAGGHLIPLIQRHLEAIYAVEAPDVRHFLVDAEELEELGATERGAREWVLVRDRGDEVDLGVYLHADDVARIDPLTPAEAVTDALGAFCTVTEGISHFLLLVHRATREEPVSLLELEAQAEVDKYVTIALHLLGAGVTPPRDLRRRLFSEATLGPGLTDAEEERYVAAGRLADRYCAALERLPSVAARLAELRRFYRMSGSARMERLRRAA